MAAAPLPDAAFLGRELGKLIDSTKAVPSQIANLRQTLSLSICGGPTSPTKQELPERIDRLWGFLSRYIERELEAEIARGDPIGGADPAVCVEAARILFRCEKDKEKRKPERWYCVDNRSLGKLQEAADKKIREKPKGDKKYFRDHLQYPILEALARLLLRDEVAYRKKQGLQPSAARGRFPTRRKIAAAVSILSLAALVFALVTIGGSGTASVLVPSDLSVSLRAGLEDGSEVAAASGSNVDLGTADGVQEVGFDATVRPIAGRRGRIPPGLRLVVVVPRKSLTGTSLPTAFLQASGTPVREAGQHASAAVTISSRQASRLGLDIPSGFRIQVKRSGRDRWEPPQLLSARWQTCSEQRCILRLPLARFTGETGEVVRLGFQTLAFGLAKDGPLLVMDMEQRRLGDRLARDGELHVSPGDRVLYSLYLANRGTESARNVVARLALPSGLRLIPASVRAATTDASTPFAVEDNLANGGVRYSTFGAGSSARFTAITEVRPSPATEMKSYWLISSEETKGTSYFDSVTATAGG